MAAKANPLYLVINSGSSSLKFKLFNHDKSGLKGAISGLVERIGDVAHSRIITSDLTGPEPVKSSVDSGIKDHTAALHYVLEHLSDTFSPEIRKNMEAVGHRVVHGRDIPKAMLVDSGVLKAIEDAVPLAPLHNPANLEGITAAAAVFDCPQVAVFDTSFHHTLPPAAYTYALPKDLAASEGLRRYGAHGTSYKYLVGAAANALGKSASELNLVIAHLGAGASMAAVQNGASVDTSMGLMMGTRCGDIDPAALIYLAEHCGMKSSEIYTLLNKKSGFLGLAGDADLRSVREAAEGGDAQAQLAIDVWVHRVRKYLGAYLIGLEGKTDAIVFSAGIGENSALARRLTLQGLESFGIVLDDAKNEATEHPSGPVEIQAESSHIKILVIPTDEELSIAQQTLEVVENIKLEA